jgi:site-specific recombinase XerD
MGKEEDNKYYLPFDSMEDMLDNYRQCLEAANRSDKTVSWYTDILRRFFTFLESSKLMKPVPELGTKELIAYIHHLQDSGKWPNHPGTVEEKGSLSPYSIQGHIRTIKAFWSWLTGEGYVEKNVLAGFPLPKVPQYIIKTLTSDHLKKLLAAIDRNTAFGAKYYCILMLFLDTGVRVSEVVKIKLSDVDFKQGLVTVLGKGKKERPVPFSKLTRKELNRYVNKFRSQTDCKNSPYLFPIASGEHISINSVQQFVRRLVDKAGLNGTKCSPHIFRHTFATQSIANGANVFVIKEIMGHASLQTTLKYTHLQIKDLKDQHDKFSPVEGLMKPK